MVRCGIVAQRGSRPAQGDTDGNHSHGYSIVDYRARRLLDRNLSLGDDYEVGNELPEEEGADKS